MNKMDILSYIEPYIKSLKIKGEEKILLINNLLLCSNQEGSVLYHYQLGIDTNIILCGNHSDLVDNDIDFRIYNEMIFYKNNYVNNTFSWNHVIENIDSEEEFLNILSSKANDGMKSFKVNNILISIFYGLIPYTKADSINLYILYGNNPIVKYEIYKKKLKSSLNIYTRLIGVAK